MTRHIEVLEKKYSEVLITLSAVEKNSPPPMADPFTGVQPSPSSQFLSNSNQMPLEPSTFGPAGDLALMGFAFGDSWDGIFSTPTPDMFIDPPSVSPSYISASPPSNTFSPPNCSTMDSDQQYTDAMVLQSLVDTGCGLVPCGGVKRALEESDQNDTWGEWKRPRIEVS